MAGNGNPAAVLIAETGGLNAMIVDSTALPEQAIASVVESAFQSAGQRCSALRVLYVQEDIYEKFLTMLKGAMDLLQVGDPWSLATDVGPIIDSEAHNGIDKYLQANKQKILHQTPVNTATDGHFIAPTLLEINGIASMRSKLVTYTLTVTKSVPL